MTAEIVPFGKYKGQPVELLAADRDYCEWLTAQPWFSEKYRNVYNVIVNYGSEPQDSPEHNQMQAQFLDDDWCFALADLLGLKGKYSLETAQRCVDDNPIYQKFRTCVELKPDPPTILSRKFEESGWDVVYAIEPAGIQTHRIALVPPLPACSCRCDHAECRPDARCKGGNLWCQHAQCKERRGIDRYDHCNPECYWHSGGNLTDQERDWLKHTDHYYQPAYSRSIRVELKPDLGDDYPSVLRQVKGYPAEYGDKRCVVVRRWGFQQVAWADVRNIFAASDIDLIAEDQLNA